jgi:hypothetical protein
MVRVVVLASIASACVACKPAPLATTIGHVSSTSVVPDRTPPPRKPRSAREALAELHHAQVSVEHSLAVPGGSVVVYAYDRLESEIGQRTAAGRDVAAELAAALRRCEGERDALDPDQRERVESTHPSCQRFAAAASFSDARLVTDCQALGVAYLDARGELLDRLDVDGPCLSAFRSLEAYDLSPTPGEELLLLATFSTHGETTQGEWGSLEDVTRLYVLQAAAGEDGPFVVEELVVELDVVGHGDACDTGTRRSLRVAGDGVLERFSQPYDDCGDEQCIDPTDEAAEDADPSELCQGEPVTAERATWRPKEQAWGAFEPFAHEGNVLPDGIML